MGIPRREARRNVVSIMLSASNKPYQHGLFEQPSLPGSALCVGLTGFNFCPEVRLKDGREETLKFLRAVLKIFSLRPLGVVSFQRHC